MTRALTLAALMVLAGCNTFSPSTTATATFDDGAGKRLSVSYQTSQEKTTPTLLVERDSVTGHITRLEWSAEATASAGVIGANTEFVTALGQGIAAGLGSVAGAAARGAAGGISYDLDPGGRYYESQPVAFQNLDQAYRWAEGRLIR